VLSYYKGDQYSLYIENQGLNVRELESIVFHGDKALQSENGDVKIFEDEISQATGCVTNVIASTAHRGKIIIQIHDPEIMLRILKIITELGLPTKYAVKGQHHYLDYKNQSVLTIHYDDKEVLSHSLAIKNALVGKHLEIVKITNELQDLEVELI